MVADCKFIELAGRRPYGGHNAGELGAMVAILERSISSGSSAGERPASRRTEHENRSL